MPLFLGLGDVLAGAFGLGDILGFGAADIGAEAGLGLGAAEAGAGAAEAAPLFAGSAADFLAAPAAEVAAGADVGGAFGLTDAGLAGLGAEGAAALGGAGADVTGAGITDALMSGAQAADLASTAGGLGALDQIATVGNLGATASDVGGASGLGGLGLGGGGPPVLANAGPGFVAPTTEIAEGFGTGGANDLSLISSGVGGDVPPTAADYGGASDIGQPFDAGAGPSQTGLTVPPNAMGAANVPGSTVAPPAVPGASVTPPAPPGDGGKGGGLFGTGISGNTALLAGAGLAPLALTMMRGEQPLPQQANQLQSQLATPLSNFSQQQLAQYQANRVNPAQQASLDAMRAQLTNQYRQMLFNQGVTNPQADSRWPQIEGLIDQQVMQSQGQMLANNINAAFAASGQAGQDLSILANMQVQQDTAYQQAINQATQAAGMVIGLGAASGKLF